MPRKESGKHDPSISRQIRMPTSLWKELRKHHKEFQQLHDVEISFNAYIVKLLKQAKK